MSSKKRKWKFRIRDILDAIDQIAQFAEGMERDGFIGDVKTRAAVAMYLTVIGEAVRSVPEEVKSKYSSVPWPKMQGLRNIIAHEYARVDFDTIWNIVEQDLPPLPAQLNTILEDSSEE